ncbi:MAG: 50S ribosomal protein L34e [Theionarchaea archaeon]|nr:50S ribosomal protein L34e [Theionarchaea archaeon]MBU7001761.1 50S ribosomal protein L34e [Theionarchaea archaeon]MBU7022290.1 50S ribosomal protein L34e [Theionarchaea archaeon]MBU7035524.1 50S ribosomal protein L34e [Theionarchaea archaeon]
MRGMYRSGSMKRKKIRTPKRTTLRFKRKKKSVPTCAECGAVLHGVSARRGKGSTPSRKYGGYLCHSCVRRKLVESVRS